MHMFSGAAGTFNLLGEGHAECWQYTNVHHTTPEDTVLDVV